MRRKRRTEQAILDLNDLDFDQTEGFEYFEDEDGVLRGTGGDEGV